MKNDNYDPKKNWRWDDLTLRMKSVENGLKEEYTSLYNSTDFYEKIKYLKFCKADETASVQAEIVNMFNKCGIKNVDVGKSSNYYKKILAESNIPTPEEMNKKVYETFLNKFKETPYPLPEEYIKRIVDRKTPEEWIDDSLRLKILKVFIKDANGLKAAGYSDNYVRKYAKKKSRNEKLSEDEMLSSLDEGIFLSMEQEMDMLKEKQDKLKNDEEYISIKRRIRERKKHLKEKYENLTIKERNELIKKDDELIELKESPIIKEVERVEGKRKEKTKKIGKFALLKIADDLGRGIFRNECVVREEIYLFAIVFDLYYIIDDPETLITEEERHRSIENVMFGDYFTNNLMRYVSEGHRYIKNGGEIQSPTERGINYKNYVEVIFLYYLKRQDLSIVEKINGVYRMAEEVYSEQKSIKNKRYMDVQENRTLFYEKEFKKNYFESEEEFKKFLVLNYDCSIPAKSTTVFDIELEQQSAYNIYEELLDSYKKNDEKYKDEFGVASLGFVSMVEQINRERVEGILDFSKYDEKIKFDIVLSEVEKDLDNERKGREVNKKIIARTDLMRLICQVYICEFKRDMEENRFMYEWMGSFPDIYEDFSLFANLWLERALMRPIDGRNLYDLILIYSVYCCINREKNGE